MQHISSITKNTTAPVLSVVHAAGYQESVPSEDKPHGQLKAIAKLFAAAQQIRPATRRRYTIDDNGGGYEGL